MKTIFGAAIATAALMGAVAGHAATFPAYGNDPSANIVITFLANGGTTTVDNGYGPYDGVEDTYIGIVNNSGKTINSINFSSPQCIGCFDGDGLVAYGAPSTYDPNGYGGPATFFTNNTGYSLTANFTGGIAPGGSTYFSLEEPVAINTLGVPEPTTWALMLLGFGGVGFAMRRHNAASAIA